MRESAARGAGDLQTVPSRLKLNINGHAEGALPLYLPHYGKTQTHRKRRIQFGRCVPLYRRINLTRRE